MTTDEEATNQKLALVEQSLDALYQTMDKIQGEKNHVSRNKLWCINLYFTLNMVLVSNLKSQETYAHFHRYECTVF